MTALVPELVNMASDTNVTTTDLLRRALVTASRLNVPDIVGWLNSELNGYEKDVPDYRVLYGYLVVQHPYHGLIPFSLNDDSIMEMVTKVNEGQSVPELERLPSNNSGSMFTRQFSPQQEHMLTQSMSYRMQPLLLFSRAQLSGIVEKVRNRILDWGLDLERRGILGEGMTFTQREKQMVQEPHIHISGVTGSQIQIGSDSSSQHQAHQITRDTAALKSVADALVAALVQSKAAGEAADELRAEIATLKAQAASPKPKWEIVKASAKSVKAIVEGAAGSVLGELAKPHVIALMGLLPS